MLTKGIVEEIVSEYVVKVRLPIYDSLPNLKHSTDSKNLSQAIICTLPNISNTVSVGDIVIVGFEDNDNGKPIILGQLYRLKKSKTKMAIDVNSLNVDNNASLSKNTTIGDISYFDIKSAVEFVNNFSLESPNLFDYTKLPSGVNNGIVVTNNNDGSFLVTDNRDSATSGGIYYTTVLPAGTYYVSGGEPYTGAFFEVIYEVDGQYVYKNNTTFTLTEPTSCRFLVGLFDASYVQDQHPTWTVSPMVNVGGSALPFEPYTGAIQHSINNSYSYNEIDTGATWVDGKKIYKKTFYIASKTITGSGSETIASISISGATNYVNCELCGKLGGGSTRYPFIGMTGLTKTIFQFDGFSTGGGGNLTSVNNSGTGETFTDIYFTVYYTK